MTEPKKLKSGNWRVRVNLGKDENGKRHYISITEKLRKDAINKAKEIEEALETGRDPLQITVGAAIDRYIAAKDNILSPSTIKGYRSIRKNNLQQLMDLPLFTITNELVQRTINMEALTHAPKTVQNIHGLLSAVLALHRPEFVLRTTLPKRQKKPKIIPSPEDVTQLLTTVRGTDMYIPALLASMLSLRRSEVCGLKWDDIDLKSGKITVRRAMVANDKGEYVIKSPKTYTSHRTLTMPLVLIDALQEQENKTGFVVQMSPAALSCQFAKIVKQNRFEHFTFHSLRHFNASVMLALNLPDKYAMERGGWATPMVMKSTYQHTFQSEQARYDKVLLDYFEQLYHPSGDTQVTRKIKNPVN